MNSNKIQKHTPSPWVATFNQKTLHTSIDFRGTPEYSGTRIANVSPEDDNNAAINVAHANAALISIAPDLMSILRQIRLVNATLDAGDLGRKASISVLTNEAYDLARKAGVDWFSSVS